MRGTRGYLKMYKLLYGKHGGKPPPEGYPLYLFLLHSTFGKVQQTFAPLFPKVDFSQSEMILLVL